MAPELIVCARAWREDPEDPARLKAYIRALERAGERAPLDLLERLIEPEQRVVLEHPVELWACFEDGRSARVGRGKPGARVSVTVPECQEWWLCESPEHPLSLELIGEAARATGAPGLEIEAEGAGRLCDRLGPLPNLRCLRVGGQGYRARVFEGLEAFSNLRELTIAEAPEYPEETLLFLGSCRSLARLDLGGRGYFPESAEAWRGLEGLRSLRLSRADLWQRGAGVLSAFEALGALEELRLADCALDERAFRSLMSVPRLRRLQLRHEPQAYPMSWLQALPRGLREIDLEHLVPEGGLVFLSALPHLEKVRLWFSRCEDADLTRLSAMTELRIFSALGCWAYSGDGVAALEGATKLEELYLGDIKARPESAGFGPTAWQALSALLRLRVLYLGYTGLDNRGLASLAPLARLQTLYARGCRGITNRGLKTIAAFPKLRELSLGPGKRITAAGLEHLKALKDLRRLLLVDCPKLGDAGLEVIAALPALRSLSLVEASGHSAAGYAALAKARGLERLELDRCRGFGESALRAYAGLPRLRELVIPRDSCGGAARRDFLSRAPLEPALSFGSPV